MQKKLVTKTASEPHSAEIFIPAFHQGGPKKTVSETYHH